MEDALSWLRMIISRRDRDVWQGLCLEGLVLGMDEKVLC